MNVLCKDYFGELQSLKRVYREASDRRMLDLYEVEILDFSNDTVCTVSNVSLDEITFSGMEITFTGATSD